MEHRHLNIVPMIFIGGLLQGETNGVAKVTEEVMEVLASILKTLRIAREVEVPISVVEL